MSEHLTERTVAQEACLRESLAGLSRLAMRQLSLSKMLTHVAEFAVQAIPGADGVGVTLFQDDRADTSVASADFVRNVDAVQYLLGEGPCITAANQRRTVSSGQLETDRAFPRFGPKSAAMGVHSVLSLPLLTLDGVLGSMNVYAHVENAFDARAVQLGELFAIPAAVSVQNAQELSQAQRLTEQLQAALSSRAVIDQAVGIIMSRTGCSDDQAFDKLRTMSQASNRKLALVAAQIVDEAVRRARARIART